MTKGNGGGASGGKAWGVNSEYGRLHDVLLCEPVNFKWLPTSSISKATLRSGAKFDRQLAMRQHREMVQAYEEGGTKVHFLEPDEALPGLRVTALARVTGRTGVEMEALTAASVACLTIYDMAKAVDRGMTISGIRLVEKRGGKSGDFRAGELEGT